MPSVNTAFKVENGLYVVGDATVSNSATVNNNLTIVNSLAVGTVNSNFIPTSNSYALGNATNLFTNLFIQAGLSETTFTSNVIHMKVANVATSLIPDANNVAFGNTTRRWSAYANNIDGITINTSNNVVFGGTANITGAITGSNTLSITGAASLSNTLGVTGAANIASTLGVVGAIAGSNTLSITGAATFSNTLTTSGLANASSLRVVGTSTLSNNVTVAGGLSVTTSGVVTVNAVATNTTFASLTFQSNNTQVFQNVTFDTDLLFLDAENNRIGIKNAAPSAVDLVTVGAGNVFFNTANSTIRMSGAGTQNSFIGLMSNTTNARFTFSTSDSSNSTVLSGGYLFYGVNSTATYSLLSLNNAEMTYKSGNVAHAGNFGIYDVSGTRVGP